MEPRGDAMKWRRILGVVAVILAMSGNLLGSGPEKRLQARWSELENVIGGKKVALQLENGARVKGRVRRVTEASIALWVKRSAVRDFNLKNLTCTLRFSDYPKGQIEIARECISRIEALDLYVDRALRRTKKTAQTVLTALAAFVGSILVFGQACDDGLCDAAIWGGIGVGGAAAVLMNLPKPSKKDVTLIEILPDPSGEGKPIATNRDWTSRPKPDTLLLERTESRHASSLIGLDSDRSAFRQEGIETVVRSLVDQSDPDRIRQQARRVLMRTVHSKP